MNKSSNRYNDNFDKVDKNTEYDLKDAISLIKNFKACKFDESVDIAINLGVDPKHADQLVRGTVSLPNGTGKDVKVIVLTKDSDKVEEAKKAGSDDAGFDELFSKIQKGWVEFDVMVATPEVMPEIGKLGRVLGPRGLMPNPKTGTVTNDVNKAVSEVKAGKVEYRVDKNGIVHVSVGKISFEEDKIFENIKALMEAVLKSKPIGLKGTYFKKFTISTTMGPGLKVNKSNFIN